MFCFIYWWQDGGKQRKERDKIMNSNIINEWLETHQLRPQELAVKHNTPLEKVTEIAKLYLLINCTTDVIYLYNQLEWYGNKELQKEIIDLVCETV